MSKFFVQEPFCLPRTFWYGKLLRKREKAGVTIFHRNLLVSQNRNNLRRNFSAFHFWNRKELTTKEVEGNTVFRRNCFCPTVPKYFVEELFCVSENFGYRNFLMIKNGRVAQFFDDCFIFSHSAETSRIGTRLFSKKFLVSKTVEERKSGDVTIFRPISPVSQEKKCFVEGLFCLPRTFW